MALKVIGSGFGRTGTMSLKMALEQLGFGPCHHMVECMGDPSKVANWQKVAAGQAVSWDEVFEGYAAQVDWPGCHVWRQLADHYPDAKVLHSVRPEESWWNSYSQTIGKMMDIYETLPMPPHVAAMTKAARDMIASQTFGGPHLDKDASLAAFRKRTEDVKAAIPPERLLVFDVAEGWEPLCAFLNAPVPDTPFPRTNAVEDFWNHFKPAA